MSIRFPPVADAACFAFAFFAGFFPFRRDFAEEDATDEDDAHPSGSSLSKEEDEADVTDEDDADAVEEAVTKREDMLTKRECNQMIIITKYI